MITNAKKSLALLALLIAAQVILLQPALAGQKTIVDGVTHIMNGPNPSEGKKEIELEELWRIGGDDEDSILLGLVSEVLIKGDRVYIFDTVLCHVEVFDLNGEHQGTLGRQGSGPGEINTGFDIVFMPDGTLGMVQTFPGKIVTVDLEGIPTGDFTPTLHEATDGRFLALVNSFGGGGKLVLTGIDISFDQTTLTQGRTHFLQSFNPDGTPDLLYHSELRTWDLQNTVLSDDLIDYVWGRTAMADDGMLFVNIPRNDYAISVFNPAGELQMVIEREYESWTRNEKATSRADNLLKNQLAQLPPNATHKVSDVDPDIVSLVARPDGTVWATTSRAMWEAKPGVLASYDVFDRQGNYIQQVEFKAEGTAWRDAVIFAEGGLVFRVSGFQDSIIGLGGQNEDTEDEGTAMEVICYRMK